MITTGKCNLPSGILKGIELGPAKMWLGRGRCPIFASFASNVSCIHLKTLLSMPFTDGAQSTASKAKNILFVRKSPPGTEKTSQMLTFLPLLPPPAGKLI
jgi:hypothetical protein